jgi:hypothetical protein
MFFYFATQIQKVAMTTLQCSSSDLSKNQPHLKMGNRECSSSHFLHFCVSWVSRRLPQLYGVETSILTNVLVKLSTVENRIALKLSLIETVTSYSQRVMTDSQIEGGVFASDVHSCQVKFLSCGETYDLKTRKLKYTYTEKTCDKRRYF